MKTDEKCNSSQDSETIDPTDLAVSPDPLLRQCSSMILNDSANPADFGAVDYLKVAEGFGFKTARITSEEEIEAVLRDAIGNRGANFIEPIALVGSRNGTTVSPDGSITVPRAAENGQRRSSRPVRRFSRPARGARAPGRVDARSRRA